MFRTTAGREAAGRHDIEMAKWHHIKLRLSALPQQVFLAFEQAAWYRHELELFLVSSFLKYLWKYANCQEEQETDFLV